jgi:hypothetical protein
VLLQSHSPATRLTVKCLKRLVAGGSPSRALAIGGSGTKPRLLAKTGLHPQRVVGPKEGK